MIRRINPFIVLGFLLLILFLVFLGVKKREANINSGSIEVAQYEAKAKMLQELKRGWSQKNIDTKLNSLAFSSKLKSDTKFNKMSDKIVMIISNVDKNEADKIIKDFLNEPFEIKKFHIKRVSEDALEIQLEVAL